MNAHPTTRARVRESTRSRWEARPTTAVGIDGCCGGWIAAVRPPDGRIEWLLEPGIADILKSLPTESTILVDMIIGLPDHTQPSRCCDRLARELLSPHGSRVFPAPPREALAADSYLQACALARAATGKAISKQCWHLFPKIRELDALADPRIRESHPELVFARLNGGHPVAASKKTPAGQNLRLKLLASILPGVGADYQAALLCYRRKDLARDDVLDALALCAVGTRPAELQALPPDTSMPQIWY